MSKMDSIAKFYIVVTYYLKYNTLLDYNVNKIVHCKYRIDVILIMKFRLKDIKHSCYTKFISIKVMHKECNNIKY